MVGSGKIIGLVLIGIGAIVAIFGVLYWAGNQQTDSSAKILGMGVCIVPAAIIAGVGVWFLMQGRSETTQFAEVEKEKRVLNIIATQGTVQLSGVALETNMTMDQVKSAIYDLVGKGLFTGYVDWKAGKLVSADAAVINQAVITGKCPNCGAPEVVGGKGVIRCDYCGAEFFIPPSAATSAVPPPSPVSTPPASPAPPPPTS